MRKVINGRTYNTETSKLIGRWSNGHYTNDFAYCSEDLYKNTRGAYFLHGEGGGNSKYGVWHGNSGGPGEQIIPLTADGAQEWAEKHLDADDYEAEFGEPEDADPSDLATRERVNFVIDTDIITRFREHSKTTGIPMSRMADAALGKYMEEANPMRKSYDQDMFEEMIRDWRADNAPEYDDLEIDEIKKDGDSWIAITHDDDASYALSDDGRGNIVIGYLGAR
jgi:hypothetical protein